MDERKDSTDSCVLSGRDATTLVVVSGADGAVRRVRSRIAVAEPGSPSKTLETAVTKPVREHHGSQAS